MKKLTVICGTNNKAMRNEAELVSSELGKYVIWSYPENYIDAEAKPQALQFEEGICCVAGRAAESDKSPFDILITHSDHIFNGIRVGILQGKISHEDVEFRFCEHEKPTVILTCDADARFAQWPEGFFDQAEIALWILLAGRNKNK